MMSKSFSTREKALLVALCVILILGLYYLMIFMPSSETIGNAQARIDELAADMIVEEAKAAQIEKMRQELEQVADTEAYDTATPVFDNFQNLLDELNSALSGADSYKLNFLEPKIEDGIAARELQLIFFSRSYNAAKRIISELYSGPFRCDIVSFKLAPTEPDAVSIVSSPVTATLSIRYYEIYKQDGEG